MIEDGIYQLLSTTSTVSAAAPGGIFPVLLPDIVTATSVSYRTLSSLPAYTLDGSPIVTTRIEYTAWANTYAFAKAATEAIRSVLDRYSGTLPNGIAVSLCWRTGAYVDGFDAERRLYSSSIDFRVTHSPQ